MAVFVSEYAVQHNTEGFYCIGKKRVIQLVTENLAFASQVLQFLSNEQNV
jgi:hypothetical protein